MLASHQQDFLARLQGVRDSGTGWKAHCPSCEAVPGHSPSLQIDKGSDGRLLVSCHGKGKCTPEQITTAVGLSVAQCLFGEPRGGDSAQQWDKVKAYDYRDRGGALHFQIVRMAHRTTGQKSFRVRRPNPAFDTNKPSGLDNPYYLPGKNGCPPLLYRLPELHKALSAKPDQWVFVVEGEKSADYCRSQGLVATTAPFGAGGGAKWLPEHSQLLAGANVCVVPDEDVPDEKGYAPGIDHAMAVCWSLYGVAGRLRLLRLPNCLPSWGLDDWLAVRDKPQTKELFELLEAAPDWHPSAADVIECGLNVGILAAEMHRQQSRGGSPEELRWRLHSAYVAAEAGLLPGGGVDPAALTTLAAAALLLSKRQ